MNKYHLLITLTSLVTAYIMPMKNCKHDLAVINTIKRNFIGEHGWTIDTGNQNIEKIKIVHAFPDYTNNRFLVQQTNDQNKYCISNGHNIHIINMQTKAKEATLVGHTDFVRCCTNTDHNDIIITGSADTTIKIWNTKNQQCLQTLHDHERDITRIASESNTLASTDWGPCLKLWDISYGQCKKTKPFSTKSLIDNNYTHLPTSLMMNNNLIYIGSTIGSIIIIDPRTTMAIYHWIAHKGTIPCLTQCKDNQNSFYSGSQEGTIKQWDLRNVTTPTNILHKKNNLTDTNYTIQNVYEDRKSKKIFSSDMDTVYVWDISSNEPTLITTKSFDRYIAANCMQMNSNETELYICTGGGIKTLSPALDFNELEALIEQK